METRIYRDPRCLEGHQSNPQTHGPARVQVHVTLPHANGERTQPDTPTPSRLRRLWQTINNAWVAGEAHAKKAHEMEQQAINALSLWRTSDTGCWGCPISQYAAKQLANGSNGVSRPCGGFEQEKVEHVQRKPRTGTTIYTFSGEPLRGARRRWKQQHDAPNLNQAHCLHLPQAPTENG